MMESVIVVDASDKPIGMMEKMEAHLQGILHRAVSVFIINGQGEWLIHRRAVGKYHSAGLWTNTCCSHPAPGESNPDAAIRRLKEEMGMQAELTELFDFKYFAELENGLTEHEIDHIFVGQSDDLPFPNPNEVMEYKWISFFELENEINLHPERYTVWFKLLYNKVQQHIYNLSYVS